MASPFALTEQSPTVTTSEYSLGLNSTAGVPTALTTAGRYYLLVDPAAFLAGDECIIRVYEKVVSGGTQRVIMSFEITNTSGVKIYDLGHLVNGFDVTAQMISATSRALPMSLRLWGADTDTAAIKALLPTSLDSGNMRCAVEAYASGQAPLQPTVAGRTAAIATGGQIGIDWNNIASPTTTQGLSGTTIKTSTDIATQISALTIPAAATVAAAVWDQLVSGHTTAATFGAYVNAANTAAATIATNLNLAVGSVAAAVWAVVSETGETCGDALRLLTARAAGKATVQDGDGNYTWRDRADTKDRIKLAKTATAVAVTTRSGT